MKMSVFFLKLWFNGIPTDDMIQKCAIPLVLKCVCCISSQSENAEHLFYHSEAAKSSLNHFANIFGIDITHDSSWKQRCINWWVNSKGQSQDRMLAAAIHLIIAWELWWLRNDIRHNDSQLVHSSIHHKVLKWIQDLNLVINPKKKLSLSGSITIKSLRLQVKHVLIKKPVLVQWNPPLGNDLKLNIDGASKGNPGISGCGGVIRNNKEEMILAFSEYLETGSNNRVEMCALYSRLLTCYQLDIRCISIESDSQLLVN